MVATLARGGAGVPTTVNRVEVLERRQLWCYLAAILLGLAAGLGAPTVFASSSPVEPSSAVMPLLGLLLFATFLQVPIAALVEALRIGAFS
jgi:ACR3 family arsenite transporter